jgi:hypothetical protein
VNVVLLDCDAQCRDVYWNVNNPEEREREHGRHRQRNGIPVDLVEFSRG